jgi:multiple sugar transport system permease protein
VKKNGVFSSIKSNLISYIFVLPFFTAFTVFILIPAILAVYLSFTNFNMLQKPQFVGLLNYLNLFVQDDKFITSIKNTLFIALITGPAGYFIAFIFAYFINMINDRFRMIYVTIFYVPSMISGVAMAVVWKVFFANDSQGYLNSFLINAGFINEPLQWLQDVKLIVPVIVFISLWMSLGTGFLSFLAGFQLVNKELIEAAKVDGVSSRLQELWYVIIPSMKPQLLFGAILTIVGSFRVGDIGAALVGFPSPNDVGLTLVLHMRDYAFIRYELGYACAVAVILFLIIFGFSRWCFSVLGSNNE